VLLFSRSRSFVNCFCLEVYIYIEFVEQDDLINAVKGVLEMENDDGLSSLPLTSAETANIPKALYEQTEKERWRKYTCIVYSCIQNEIFFVFYMCILIYPRFKFFLFFRNKTSFNGSQTSIGILHIPVRESHAQARFEINGHERVGQLLCYPSETNGKLQVVCQRR